MRRIFMRQLSRVIDPSHMRPISILKKTDGGLIKEKMYCLILSDCCIIRNKYLGESL